MTTRVSETPSPTGPKSQERPDQIVIVIISKPGCQGKARIRHAIGAVPSRAEHLGGCADAAPWCQIIDFIKCGRRALTLQWIGPILNEPIHFSAVG